MSAVAIQTLMTMLVSGTVAVWGSWEQDAIENHLHEYVMDQVVRLFKQHTGSLQILVRQATQVAHQK